MAKLTWTQWYEEFIERYSAPYVTYGGMVMLCGKAPKGAKKRVERPSKQQIDKYRKDDVITAMLRELYERGRTVDEAWRDML